MRRTVIVLVLGMVALACGASPEAEAPPGDVPPARILLAGDISLARGVGPIVAADPESVFAGLRRVVRTADVAAANLESPLTRRPHQGAGPNDLRADPAAAALVAATGFDVMGVANNHAGDGGPAGLTDSLAALAAVDVASVGGGATRRGARDPAIFEVGPVTIGFLAFDATGHGLAATADAPGVAVWDDAALTAAAELREQVDVLVVGVHGGAEYLLRPDTAMQDIAAALVEVGADVVWGHGAHVAQPVTVVDPDADGRPTVVATSLGNLLFDQSLPGTDRGVVLEVLAGRSGVAAMRIGDTSIRRGRVAFDGWRMPGGDAVLLDGEWWALTGELPPEPPGAVPDLDGFRQGDPVAAATGDVDGDAADDLVVSFRRPFRPAALHDLLPGVQWRDAAGRSAHLGVFDPDDFGARWVASAMARPVTDLAVCDGAIAVRYGSLDDPTATAAGGWVWSGFGWDEAADLEGFATIGCVDADGDGRLDPLVLRPGRAEVP